MAPLTFASFSTLYNDARMLIAQLVTIAEKCACPPCDKIKSLDTHLVTLDAAPLGGERDIHEDLSLEEGGKHGAQVGQVVVPPQAVLLRAPYIHPVQTRVMQLRQKPVFADP
jgi:hypothetical protein